MAKIYEFPTQINGMYTQAFIEWSYGNLEYEEEDEYIMNQYYQEQNEQRKRQTCFAHRFVRKIISMFH